MAESRAASRAGIDRYIRGLHYDPRRLLSVAPDGSTAAVPVEPPSTERTRGSGAVIICTKRKYSLSKNLSDVVILNPTAGVVYPGALVLADENLAEGRATPITLPRAPMTLSLGLPGLANPTVRVPRPTNSTVQTALNQQLEVWNQQPASQGYVNPARSYLHIEAAYSSQQVALELGFSAKWASGDAASQLNASSSTERSVVLAFYKQVFYSVTMDYPPRPADVFADTVTPRDVEAAMNADHPPAYVRNVDYGRLLMVKMETSTVDTRLKLTGAVKQVTSGGVEAGGSIAAEYNDIVKNATFTAVALGGGAQTAALNFSGTDDGLKNLRQYLVTDATYRRDNPGLPVAYTVAFLKDDAHALMGFTTDYTETECIRYPNGFVILVHHGWYVARFQVTWEEPNAPPDQREHRWESGDQTAGYRHQVDLPGDAQNVHIQAWAATGKVWDPWAEALNVWETGPSNKIYTVTGATFEPTAEITTA